MMWLDVLTPNPGQALTAPVRVCVRGRSMAPTLRSGDEVLVEPVSSGALRVGDWIVVRDASGVYVHRYLGLRDGRLLTKGDGHLRHDPLWEAGAVLGRVIEARRDGRCFYERTAAQMRRERWLATGHHIVGDVWGAARRLKSLIMALFALLAGAAVVFGAVVLVSFQAEVVSNTIKLTWDTASETRNVGFYLFRSLVADEGYVNISGFIESLDQGAGASYEFIDTKATPGITYYYTLQDVPDDGTTGEVTDPITAIIPLPPGTPTYTPIPTRTPTPTPSATPLAATTPNPDVRFWADKTSLPAGECATIQWQTTNIKAVYLDGDGVLGDGARTMCPCDTTTYVLTVDYQAGGSEDFPLTLTVTGECTNAQRTGTPTPTPRPTTDRPVIGDTPTPTATPVFARPTSTPIPAATQTRVPSPTPTLSPTGTSTSTTTPSVATASPSPVATARVTRAVVEGDARGVRTETALSVWLLVVGGIVGLGFVGAGILMWKQRQ